MAQPYYKTSKITGKTYDLFSIIRILNIAQAIFYIQNDIPLQDIEISEDRKTGKPILVFYFIRSDTKEVFDLWCKNKEEQKQ